MSGLGRYFGRRLLLLIFVVWCVLTIIFALFKLLPGDPTSIFVDSNLSVEMIERQKTLWGLNDPVWLQYLRYLKNMAVFDFGDSFFQNEPVREILLQGFLGEKFGRDSIWEAHLAGELWNTNVPLQAVLDTFEYSLRDVINWQVGTRIPLNATPQSDIALLCGDVPMFSGRMGRKGGNIAVRIGEKVERIRGTP